MVLPTVHPYVAFLAILGLTLFVALLGCIRWPRIPLPELWSRKIPIWQAAEIMRDRLGHTNMGYFARELGTPGLHYWYQAMLLDRRREDGMPLRFYGRRIPELLHEEVDFSLFGYGMPWVRNDETSLRGAEDFRLEHDKRIEGIPDPNARNVEGPPVYVDVRVRKRDLKRFIADCLRRATVCETERDRKRRGL